jgi:hypothetical protein
VGAGAGAVRIAGAGHTGDGVHVRVAAVIDGFYLACMFGAAAWTFVMINLLP